MSRAAADHGSYAGLVSRVGALAIDVSIVTVLAAAVRVLPGVVSNEVLGGKPGWLTLASTVLATLAPWAYFTLCWWLAGQTAGDLLLGIAVRRRDGSHLSLTQAALRAAAGMLLAPLWIIGMLAILWEPRRRAWHDRVFRTVVRYAGKAHPAAQAAR